MSEERESATLGGGCFWCLEAVFNELRGVESVVSGYMGGRSQSPSYEEVCSGRSGHVEVVRIVFDPAQISFRELLQVFFAIHDPTTRDRQGADVGSQYRSAIFFHSEAQHLTAAEMIAAIDQRGDFTAPVVTQIQPAAAFFPAEGYHQQYFARNTRQPYCQAVIAPKLAHLRRRFADRLVAG